MNMTKITLAVIIIVTLLTLSSGCIEEGLQTTAYTGQDGSELYLHSDGKYHIWENSEAFHGNYTEIAEQGRLFIDLDYLGLSFMLVKNGTDYIDDDGEIWTLVT